MNWAKASKVLSELHELTVLVDYLNYSRMATDRQNGKSKMMGGNVTESGTQVA